MSEKNSEGQQQAAHSVYFIVDIKKIKHRHNTRRTGAILILAEQLITVNVFRRRAVLSNIAVNFYKKIYI